MPKFGSSSGSSGHGQSQASHALAVDDGGARLIVFRLGDPHLLKGAEGSQDGAPDPHAVLPLRRSDHLAPTQRSQHEPTESGQTKGAIHGPSV